MNLEISSGNNTKENNPVCPGVFLVHFILCRSKDVQRYSKDILFPR